MLLVLDAALSWLDKELHAGLPPEVLQELAATPPSRLEKARYRLITERTECLFPLLRRDWYQHRIHQADAPAWRHALTFPAYLKSLWRIPSWRALPAQALQRLLARQGLRPKTPNPQDPASN